MNLKNNPALMDQLAASYALGTLRGGARRRFEVLARDHAPLRAAALIWQGRLASVAELQLEVTPSPAVWKRIENLVNVQKQARAMLAARAPAPTAAPVATGWWSSLGLWRGATAAGIRTRRPERMMRSMSHRRGADGRPRLRRAGPASTCRRTISICPLSAWGWPR